MLLRRSTWGGAASAASAEIDTAPASLAEELIWVLCEIGLILALGQLVLRYTTTSCRLIRGVEVLLVVAFRRACSRSCAMTGVRLVGTIIVLLVITVSASSGRTGTFYLVASADDVGVWCGC